MLYFSCAHVIKTTFFSDFPKCPMALEWKYFVLQHFSQFVSRT